MTSRKFAEMYFRRACLTGGLVGFLVCILLSVGSHLQLVIADSDLGASGEALRRTAGILAGEFVVYVFIGLAISQFHAWLICLLLWGLLGVSIIAKANQNDVDWYQGGQLCLAVLTGLLLASLWKTNELFADRCRAWIRAATFAGLFFAAYRQTLYTFGLRPQSVAPVIWDNYRIPDSDKTMGIILPLSSSTSRESKDNALYGIISSDGKF